MEVEVADLSDGIADVVYSACFERVRKSCLL